jgi:DNA repair protein RadC
MLRPYQIEENRSIKSWNEGDRPREKLVMHGANVLSDAELLAILIGTGTRNESAVDLGKKLMQGVNNNLITLNKLSLAELQKVNGIGLAKAVTIAAALELSKRRQMATVDEKRIIKASKDIYEEIGPLLRDLNHEEFWVLALNRRLRVIASKRISTGGISETIVDVRLILKFGIENNASNLVLAHNHPSGNLNPSESDLRLTSDIRQAAKFMNMPLIDHVIVADTGYFSFADAGKL